MQDENSISRRIINKTGFTGVRRNRYGTFESFVIDATRGGAKTYCGSADTAKGAHDLYIDKYEEIYGRPPRQGRNTGDSTCQTHTTAS
jgi:hypothetical protein